MIDAAINISLILTHLVNNGLGNDHTNSFPKPTLTSHWWDFVALTRVQFYSKYPSYYPV